MDFELIKYTFVSESAMTGFGKGEVVVNARDCFHLENWCVGQFYTGLRVALASGLFNKLPKDSHAHPHLRTMDLESSFCRETI